LLLLKFIFVDCVQTLQWEHHTRARELCTYSTEVPKVFIPNHPSGSMPESFRPWFNRCRPLATLFQLEWTWTSTATQTWLSERSDRTNYWCCVHGRWLTWCRQCGVHRRGLLRGWRRVIDAETASTPAASNSGFVFGLPRSGETGRWIFVLKWFDAVWYLVVSLLSLSL